MQALSLKFLCSRKVSDVSCLPQELQEFVAECEKRPVIIPKLSSLAACVFLDEEVGQTYLDEAVFWWISRVLETKYKDTSAETVSALCAASDWELSEEIVTSSVCVGRYTEEPLPDDILENLKDFNDRNHATRRSISQKILLCNLLKADKERYNDPQVQIFLS
ncbi:hypothetical protein [Brazilian marseillevirus]|uniref:hypothetical protein n=1 Tax=Brazilian marseillevirus TaxID=1813599 RepID=UPI000782DAA9|nr:hypothetical protein A3303_gp126 [Brazilian marseillevirus]AMQ10634.1 hypothetical protein [Brazilian marseillevirus]